MEGVLFQTSLIAAFVAGMVALFAPCCISFLLPAYLGSVFKTREKVVGMTLIFGAGIFVVMMPAVLGVAALSRALFVYHNQLYTVGGVVMLLSAAITFLNLKFPMPHFGYEANRTIDVASIFTLGIFSGITSACCAPVLIGILTLTFLSPNFLGALLIGAMYVVGMVMPLLVIALFFSGKLSGFGWLRKHVFQFYFLGETRVVLVGNLIASMIFAATGGFILYFNATGKLGMGEREEFTRIIIQVADSVNTYTAGNTPLNLGFFGLIVGLLYVVLKKK